MKPTLLLNQSRALRYMEECGVDAIVATSPINVGYISGYFCWLNSLLREYMARPGASSNLPDAYAIFTSDGETALVVNSIFSADAIRLSGTNVYLFGSPGLDHSELATSPAEYEELWNLLTRTSQPVSPVSALTAALCDKGLSNAQIGIELDGMPQEKSRQVFDGLPGASFRDCTNLLRLVRAAKTPEEIERLTRAAEISEAAGMEALTLARPGTSVRELVQQFHARAAAMGAVFDHFAYSPRGLGIAMEADSQLSVNDILYVDFGCKFGQYYSDTGLTLAMTELVPPLERRYAALQASIAAGVSQMKPGVKASAIQRSMTDEIASHEFGSCFPHGHGLGLEVRDYPIIVPDSGLMIHDDCVNVPADLPMEEGMVNNLEACFFLPGIGSVHLEKTYLVTADGNRELVTQDRDSPVFAAIPAPLNTK